ncbi:uncharacterized protein A1O9_01190 [Exophiala aquamarina CBS 119918]|uniref:BRCT domain-containing protein n=1 Tax=Exophiala aquamarina CBS 119918 TaxID=1182545 RepID=A0A072PV49_9EURO|nr:uncharacterized protein A1O9_01190 [Exophiala aquamarina CBS 119918]KEF63213.1 hypothetical protein A1O9_01190 [Exophiala aquamarina CBS 119918]
MAPRKVASPTRPRRVTRARAADSNNPTPTEDPLKRKSATKAAVPTTSAAKASEAKSRVTKKTATPTAAKATTRAARSKKTAPPTTVLESDNEEEDVVTISMPQSRAKPSRPASRNMAAKSTATTESSLAAAPRRRIKVTPLDAVASEPEPDPESKSEKKASSRAKKEKSAATGSTATSRSKRTIDAVNRDEPKDELADTDMAEAKPKKRGRARVNAVEVEELPAINEKKDEEAPKTRGRPRKEKSQALQTQNESAVSVRQTRARAGSTASAPSVEPTISVVVRKKKVTFQDIPDEEDEKENFRPATKAGKKSTTTSTKKAEPLGRGIRAKPIRKPAPATTTKTTRGRAAGKNAKETDTEVSEKIQQRALTPKKITQVAKAEVGDSDASEDELAGAKTPVRDLSMSPKRAIVASIQQSSPVKKLDFTPALSARPQSPKKLDGMDSIGILSPPRRNPASPAKDIYDQSPRRAPEGVTVFRAHLLDSSHGRVLPFNATNSQTQLLQLPRRGVLEASIFPASAAKLSKSPFKASLLSSPARRLFSPSKQKTPARISPIPLKKTSVTPLSAVGSVKSPGNVDLAMTSHFRSSMSPQRSARVYRMSDDELAEEMGADPDFDQSVLNVRSPLKVDKVMLASNEPAEEMQDEDPFAQSNIVQEVDQAEGDKYFPLLPLPSSSPASSAVTALSPTMCLAAEADLVGDETIADPEQEEGESSEIKGQGHSSPSASTPMSEREDSVVHHPEAAANRPRMSNILFSRLRDGGDESDDELAGEQTPEIRPFRPSFRPIPNQSDLRSRLSTGIAPPSASRNLGFTPLAARVRGWAASSPEKKVKASDIAAQSRGLFSPLAQVHVEGSVELNRQPTPGRSASKRMSLASHRQSFGPSVTGSPANPEFFADGMAAQDFEDQNEVQEDQKGSLVGIDDLHKLVQEDKEEQNLVPSKPVDSLEPSSESEEENSSEDLDNEPGDLTTDLIKFTNASETAMVDFKALASEAADLADEGNQEDGEADAIDVEDTCLPHIASKLDMVSEKLSSLSTSSENYADENVAPAEEHVVVPQPEFQKDEHLLEEHVLANQTVPEIEPEEEHHVSDEEVLEDTVLIHRDDSNKLAITIAPGEESEFQHKVNVSTSLAITPSAVVSSTAGLSKDIEPIDFNVTPIRPDPSLPRYINTVVSKVPLRPEGDVPPDASPLKVVRKRARSLSSASSLAVKRRSLGLSADPLSSGNEHLATPNANNQIGSSPRRRIRSAAPSPAHSLFSTNTTPGQISFAVDDFGDSTLDGIELPEDELMSDDIEDDATPARHHKAGAGGHDDTFMTIGSTLFKTPIALAKKGSNVLSSVQSNQTSTPHYAMSTKSSKIRNEIAPMPTPSKAAVMNARTPATTSKTKTPMALSKGKTPAKPPGTSRTPLRTVGNGVLTGAVVHVDVHTSEGADASDIYVALLTMMGARCIKEWRWNPRASVAPAVAAREEPVLAETPSSSIGITHVVYKDGGKRTLEKVRAAKGQVLCVGVGWVLDCEREGKWLDETGYEVDSAIIPRGGSRRRKSMEPRMLINANGLLSAKRDGRRSISAEYAGLTNEMRLDLINTPVRGRKTLVGAEDENSEADLEDSIVVNAQAGDESEISSTYNSPTAATIGGGGETADMGRLLANSEAGEEGDTEIGGTPNFRSLTRNANVSTPQTTSLAVDYDPRTAATPLTPYLIAKGKGLVQMSAPPKQIQKGLFERDEDGENSLLADAGEGESNGKNAEAGGEMKGEMKKFQVKMNGVARGNKAKDFRRKTLAAANIAFQPVVGSPLRKQE